MVNFEDSNFYAAISDLLNQLNPTKGSPCFAVGGSVALRLHGVRLGRSCKDLDIISLSPNTTARSLRRSLANAGCVVPQESKFKHLFQSGHVPFNFQGIECEILSQHGRAKNHPVQVNTASRLLHWMEKNVSPIVGLPVLDLDVIVVWMTLFGREKDQTTIQALVEQTTFDGKPFIRNRDRILEYVIEDRGMHSKEAKFLQETLWPRWFASY
jgi:hypothetical protein